MIDKCSISEHQNRAPQKPKVSWLTIPMMMNFRANSYWFFCQSLDNNILSIESFYQYERKTVSHKKQLSAVFYATIELPVAQKIRNGRNESSAEGSGRVRLRSLKRFSSTRRYRKNIFFWRKTHFEKRFFLKFVNWFSKYIENRFINWKQSKLKNNKICSGKMFFSIRFFKSSSPGRGESP